MYPGRSGNCILTGAYTNNAHVLVRYDVKGPEDKFISLVLSQYQKSNDLPYTLACYSTESFSLGKPRAKLPHNSILSATLNPRGGPMGSSSYDANPMFAVQVPHPGSTLQIRLSTSSSEAVHALLVPVHGFGDMVKEATADPVVDSGKYRHGFVATPRSAAPPGPYVLVISRYCRTKESCAVKIDMTSSLPLKIRQLQ